MGAFNVQALLSAGSVAGKTYNQTAGQDATKIVRDIRVYWVAAYTKRFPGLARYVISFKEGAMLKSACLQYGPEHLKRMIDRLLTDFETMPYIKGFPTVFSLCYFKRQIHAETELGKRVSGAKERARKAQYDSSAAKNDNSWGNLL